MPPNADLFNDDPLNNDVVCLLLRRTADNLRQGWCQQSMAKDDKDQPVRIIDANARSFCLMGAIIYAADSGWFPDCASVAASGALRYVLRCRRLTDWNDALDRTQADVVAAIERAMAPDAIAAGIHYAKAMQK